MFFRKRALGVKEMVESIPAPLNPLSQPLAATATECFENDDDEDNSVAMSHKLEDDDVDLASEDILRWLGCTGFGDDAANMPPDPYSQ